VGRMDELASIRAFINVVDAGSFSAVARRTNVSISVVARLVKSLEDELGVILLNRSTRSQSLTEAGRVFYDRIRPVTNDLTAAKLEAKSFHETVKGVLRVSLRVSAATTAIGPALPGFLAQHPELTLDVSLTDERLDLIANNIDVAVWLGDLPDSELIARRLSPGHREVCGAPKYFELRGMPSTPEDLMSHNCLLYTASSYDSAWTFTKYGVQRRIPVAGNLRSDNGVVLLSAALAGVGLVVLQEWTVRHPIAEGRLVRIFDDYSVNPIDNEAALHVVYPGSRGASRKIRAFVDFLIRLFRESSP
jgi:DNA-binding transcriptional LysR family regulator